MKSLSHYDSMSPATMQDPFAFYRALQEEAPVYRDPGTGSYLVSRYEDVLAVIHDPRRFSSAVGPLTKLPPKPALEVLMSGHPPVPTLLTADPPEHIRYRMLVSRAFAPRRVARLERALRRVAEETLERCVHRGEMELVADFAVPFPLTLIADQLGVPREDMPRFKRWADDNVAFLGGMISDERYLECAHSILEYQRYFEERIEACRARPREGILSDVVNASSDAVLPLGTAELLSIFQQIIVAGHETTTSAFAGIMRRLLEDPEPLALVTREPALVPAMVEEGLRLESPTQTMFRLATEDAEIAGVEIPKGARVGVMYGAANRDPRVFPDPDRFDVRRPNARSHLAFGHGEHYCIGAGLARAELCIGFETLLSRLRHPRLAPHNDFSHHPSFILRGLKALHVVFDPP